MNQMNFLVISKQDFSSSIRKIYKDSKLLIFSKIKVSVSSSNFNILILKIYFVFLL